MSSKLEPAIWSRDAGQQIPCFDRRQLTITWLANIKDVCCILFGDKYTSHIIMLFTGREVPIGKNCARGLKYIGHSFSQYGPTKAGE